MKSRSLFLTVVCLGWLVCPTNSVHAYYDDVHYALTYYIAREIGYTPEQALRLAGATVSIDYYEATEPVQAGLSSLLALPRAAEPRWRFHAFRNEIKFKNPVGSGADAEKADLMIREQRLFLWKQSIEDRNPGAFLHFFQDEVPHARYGTSFGHWPLAPVAGSDLFYAHERDNLPTGGTTDWLTHYTEAENMTLATQTATALTTFMRRISPYQKPRPLDTSACLAVILELRRVNKAPVRLRDEMMDVFVDAYVKPDLLGHFANRANLSPEQVRDIEKHRDGTDLKAAVDVVNAALQNAKMLDEPLTKECRRYNFNSFGKFQKDASAELAGTLKIKVYKESGEGRVPFTKGKVALKLAKTRDSDSEYVLGEPRPLTADGEPVEFAQMPVGDLTIEVTDAKGNLLAQQPTFLDRPDKTVNVKVTGLSIVHDPSRAEILVDSEVPVDLIVVFDVTSSMQSSLDSIRDQAIDTIRRLRERSGDLRLGLVAFRDYQAAQDEKANGGQSSVPFEEYPLTADVESQFAVMKTWTAAGGGDTPEDQLAGLMLAIGMKWRNFSSGRKVTKIIVVITDASLKNPDYQGNTPEKVAAAAEAVDPAHIYPIIVGSDPQAIADGKKLADLTGGQVLSAASGDQVATVLLDAVNVAIEQHGGSRRGWLLTRGLFCVGLVVVLTGLFFVTIAVTRKSGTPAGGALRCPKCGRAVPAGKKFCAFDGTPVEAPQHRAPVQPT